MRVGGGSRQQLLALLLGLAGLACIHSYLPALPSSVARRQQCSGGARPCPLFGGGSSTGSTRPPAAFAPLGLTQQRARYARQAVIAASTFSSFFTERTGAANATAGGGAGATGASGGSGGGSGGAGNLAYELRLLELEGRILKLEGVTARAGKGLGASGGSGVGTGVGMGSAGKKGVAAGGAGGSGQFSHILPDGEQLLLGCTFAGAMLGLLVGRALLSKQMYLGGVGGAVLGVHFFNKEGNFGACIRALGKLVLYACDRLAYAWSELKFNWKAWRVYERSFKKLESLDKEMQVSERIKAFDRQYQVSSNVNSWVKKFQSAAKNMEENLKEQAIYWQRAQRLREEQKQANMIQQEITRQQERERLRQQGGGVGGGMGGEAGGNGNGNGGYGSGSSSSSGAGAYQQQGQGQGQSGFGGRSQGSGMGGHGSQHQGPGAGGGFQAVVGDARWSDRSEVQHSQQQQPPHPSASMNNGGGLSMNSGTSAAFVSSQAAPGEAGAGASAPSSSVLSSKGPLFELNSFLNRIGGPTSTKTRGNRLRADAAAAMPFPSAPPAVGDADDRPVQGPTPRPVASDPFAFASVPPVDDGGVIAPSAPPAGPFDVMGNGSGHQQQPPPPQDPTGGGGIGGGIRF